MAGAMTEPSPALEAASGSALLIDDEPAVRGLFKRLARSARWDTIEAIDGIGRAPDAPRAEVDAFVPTGAAGSAAAISRAKTGPVLRPTRSAIASRSSGRAKR
jgi:hypothetical protein